MSYRNVYVIRYDIQINFTWFCYQAGGDITPVVLDVNSRAGNKRDFFNKNVFNNRNHDFFYLINMNKSKQKYKVI